MEHFIYFFTLVGTALVLSSAFTSVIAFRFGAPLLLVFLSIGLIAGSDGLGIPFGNAHIAYFIGSVALAVILFDSGFGTPLRAIRQAAAPALMLSTAGVLITASLFAVAAHLIFGLPWLEAFLLGAIVGSTDAAAVFFLLRVGGVSLRERVRSTLEIESGSNDPIAVFLTLALVSAISAGGDVGPGALAADIALGFVRQMGIGGVMGVAGGYGIVWLVHKLSLERGLVPIFVIALALLVFSIAGVSGGSGFLAVYLAGLIAGNRLRSAGQFLRFQEGMSWLAQIVMFLMLGLFAVPSQFLALLVPSILLAVFLILVARPLAVAICLAPFGFPNSETAFVSWVGLRGAVSILLALTPLIGGLENGRLLFNVGFIIVMTSLLIQGWTVLPLARRLGLIVPPRVGPLAKYEVDLPGAAHHELLAYRLAEGSPVARGSRIPRWARPALVVRADKSMSYQNAGRLQPDDHVYIFVPDTYPKLLDRLFASPAELSSDDADFFGAFTIDPNASMAELADAYGLVLDEGDKALSISEMILMRLGGSAEYADRVSVPPVELIVRDADEDGAITSVGLSFEPHTSTPEIPIFLRWGAISDPLRRFAGSIRTQVRMRRAKMGRRAGDPPVTRDEKDGTRGKD